MLPMITATLTATLAATLATAPAAAPAAIPARPPAPPAAIAPGQPAEALSRDDRGRPQIGVMVNGQGPFPMIVDTAAQTSLLAPSLAEALHLPAIDSDVTINGATGQSRAQVYPVDRFASRLFDAKEVGILALPNSGSTSAKGIVGMEYFSAGRLLFDLAGGRLETGASAPAGTGFVALKGTVRNGSLLVVPITINGVAMSATVDTGAGVTVANHAALKALGWADTDPRLVAAGAIRGATAQTAGVRRAVLERVQIGPVGLGNVPLYVTMGDGSPTPGIILGSDLLGLLAGFAIDFPRQELHIRVPGSTARPAVGGQ